MGGPTVLLTQPHRTVDFCALTHHRQAGTAPREFDLHLASEIDEAVRRAMIDLDDEVILAGRDGVLSGVGHG